MRVPWPRGRAGAFDEALLYEEGFVDILYRPGLLAHGRGYGIQTHGAALELLDYGAKDTVVHAVQTARVDIEGREGPRV